MGLSQLSLHLYRVLLRCQCRVLAPSMRLCVCPDLGSSSPEQP